LFTYTKTTKILMKDIEQPNKNHNLIYDVGMHKGEDTAYYLKKGFKVIAFEADPTLAEQCRQKFANEIEKGKLVIVEGAIIEFSTERENKNTVSFFKNNENSVWGTVDSNWADRNEHLGTSNEVIEVQAIDFSKYLQQYGIPYYLKIDIEGMDLVCLEALKNFNEKPDYISIESEKVSFNKLIKEFELFKQLGYTKFQAINQQNITRQKEQNPSKEGVFLNYKFQGGSSGVFGTDLPNKWKSYKQILRNYKYIFMGYKYFGDNGLLCGKFVEKILLKIINKFSKSTVPGWYDTHAKHDTSK